MLVTEWCHSVTSIVMHVTEWCDGVKMNATKQSS